MSTWSLLCSAWESLKMIKSESETSSSLYSVLLWWCQSTLTWSEEKLLLKSICLQLHFLFILQFWTVLSRIVQRSAWFLDIHYISVFWWFCSSCHMLKCTLFNHWWFNSFFSFITCFWWSSYTSSFILLWSFHVISLRKWKSWWFLQCIQQLLDVLIYALMFHLMIQQWFQHLFFQSINKFLFIHYLSIATRFSRWLFVNSEIYNCLY